MGIDARKKSILASYHGRYHTIGVADLRAVSTDMSPLYSGGFRSTDSEAMNIAAVMGEVPRIRGEQVKIYTGDGHTTSRISAGMVFLSHGVVAAGRILGEPKMNRGRGRIRRLKKNIPLLSIIPVYEICEAVERSNHVKRKTRIVEGSKARVERQS